MIKKYKIFIENTRYIKKLWKFQFLEDLLSAGFIIYHIHNHFIKCPKYVLYFGSTYYLKKEYK